MSNTEQSDGPPLGRDTVYPERYDASLLYPVARADNRRLLGACSFHGEDVWNAWELSWLDRRGKPCVAWAELRVGCDSPNLIESKSLKLYLNSLNQTVFDDVEQLSALIANDLSACAGAPVRVRIQALDVEPVAQEWPGRCLDALDVAIEHYHPEPALLQLGAGEAVDECWFSHLLRSRCPVTGQPDWGSVAIRYSGPVIEPGSLLRYIVSYRQHPHFHEHCVEQIYSDILWHCRPRQLAVYARYLRRGGLDINPYRASVPGRADNTRRWRQ